MNAIHLQGILRALLLMPVVTVLFLSIYFRGGLVRTRPLVKVLSWSTFVAIVFALLWTIPSESQIRAIHGVIFDGDVAVVKEVCIKPKYPQSNVLSDRNLVSEELCLSMADGGDKVVTALAQSHRFDPNHPRTEWVATIEIRREDGSGKIVLYQTGTRENGVYFHVHYGGLTTISYRCDEVGPILKQIVAQRGE